MAQNQPTESVTAIPEEPPAGMTASDKQEPSFDGQMSQPSLTDTNLFKPIKVGNVELKHRFFSAPTTRFRASDDFVPTDSMLSYYEQRAENNGGLIVAEATFPDYSFGLYPNAPMIKTPEQVAAWKKIVDAVHKQGSFFSIQLWHLGRVAVPQLNKKYNVPLVGPSKLYVDESSEKAAKEAGNELHELTIPEIEAIVKEFAAGAKRVVDEAKADFVEILAGGGYLLDQFNHSNINKRTDKYGGSIENRARLILEVVDACIEAVGAEHVGIKLSPYAAVNGLQGVDTEIHPISSYGYILSELERRGKEGKRIAYITMIEPRVNGTEDSKDTRAFDSSWVGEIWKGTLLRAGAYLNQFSKYLIQDVNKDDRTLIGAARYFTSNPDLIERLRKGQELTPYDRSKFYTPATNDGYITWTKYGEDPEKYKGLVAVKPQPLS
ncbi:hypothetical protein KL925_003772 [Ogataea polymorpha]|nr:hypothetical protein KL925_003772 [Ogataea polymorpha]